MKLLHIVVMAAEKRSLKMKEKTKIIIRKLSGGAINVIMIFVQNVSRHNTRPKRRLISPYKMKLLRAPIRLRVRVMINSQTWVPCMKEEWPHLGNKWLLRGLMDASFSIIKTDLVKIRPLLPYKSIFNTYMKMNWTLTKQ